jgi:hypothetical protein
MILGRSLLALVLMVVFIGCGASAPDGPKRFQVRGKVTQGGVPLAAGIIQFEPDSTKGNSGPGTSCPITNGEYQAVDGSISGAMIARISPPPAVSGTVGPIVNFPVFETKCVLPAADSEQNFDVPGDEKKK